jgi:3-oxoacyl-[acyl-carrier protein] reductase
MSTSRIALVTGASRGIGKACAFALKKAGHKVILAARNRALLDQVASELGEGAFVVEIDLSSEESIRTAIKKASTEFGTIEILVNNAGITKDMLALRMKTDDFNSVIQTNLTGAFVASQAVMQGMMKARWGRIINLASIVGEVGNVGQANYVSSKAGLIGLTKALALELCSRNITVNAVAPGFIETDMTQVLSDEVKAKLMEKIPLGRMGTAEDIAAAVAFLASEEAAYITGHTLDVNGGMFMK